MFKSKIKDMTPTRLKALATAAEDALAEALAGAKIYPGNEHMHVALCEEVGEVANALLEAHRDPTNAAKQAKVYAEAMQAAAMCLRIAIEGSAEFSYVFETSYAEAFKTTSPPAAPQAKSPAKLPTKKDPPTKAEKDAKAAEQARREAEFRKFLEEIRKENERQEREDIFQPNWPIDYPKVWLGDVPGTGVASGQMTYGGGAGIYPGGGIAVGGYGSGGGGGSSVYPSGGASGVGYSANCGGPATVKTTYDPDSHKINVTTSDGVATYKIKVEKDDLDWRDVAEPDKTIGQRFMEAFSGFHDAFSAQDSTGRF